MIYVIDDDVSIRKALQRLLQSAGLPVCIFPSGDALLATVVPVAADCLIVDMHGPDGTGLELQQRLLQLGVRAPVIFTTGFDSEETRSKARQAGAVAFFLKPVDGQALLDAINSALEQAAP